MAQIMFAMTATSFLEVFSSEKLNSVVIVVFFMRFVQALNIMMERVKGKKR